MTQKDVAVVGVGYWGKNLARNYHQLGALHTLCDHNLHHLAYYQTQYRDVACIDDFNNLLSNPKINKIVIATPTATHYELAKQALDAGKDVFVEKAMCETSEQASEIVALAKKKNSILMVGHLLNYHPAIVEVKKLILNDAIGRILHCSFTRLNFGSMGAETSALWAFAPHDISILFSLTNQQSLLNLEAKHKSFFSKEYMDQSWLHFEFSDHLSADIHVGWAFPTPERRFTILGEKGMLVFDDLQPPGKKISFWKNEVDTIGKKIAFKAQEKQHIHFPDKEPLKEECIHFLNCCESRETPLTDGFEGLRVMQILEAAKKESLCTF